MVLCRDQFVYKCNFISTEININDSWLTCIQMATLQGFKTPENQMTVLLPNLRWDLDPQFDPGNIVVLRVTKKTKHLYPIYSIL